MANVNFAQAVDYALQTQRLCTPTVVLKPEQWVAIEVIYNGRDVFVWLPTGFGKSQALPFVFDYKLCLISDFIGQFHLCAYFAIDVNSSICLNYIYAQATLMRSHAVV